MPVKGLEAFKQVQQSVLSRRFIDPLEEMPANLHLPGNPPLLQELTQWVTAPIEPFFISIRK